MLAEGQVQGGIAQGIGFTLMEEIRFDRGKMENPSFQDYIVPGPSDLPRMEIIFVETNDPEGPYGAKGVGEPALDPVPAAIVNAIYDAVGVRVTRLPITPERLRAAIRAKEKDSPGMAD
jgi:CO/xanthine dehydrogenase Mo-binding subunit